MRGSDRHLFRFGLALLIGLSIQPALKSGLYAQSNQSLSVLQQESIGLYRQLPDVSVQLSDGSTVMLSSLWQKRPILLAFFYRKCSGICDTFLRNLHRSVMNEGSLGSAYQVLVISISPEDDAAAMNSVARLFDVEHNDNWHFAVTSAENREKLFNATGFWTKDIGRSNDNAQQFDHPALVAAIKDGQIIQKTLGVNVSKDQILTIMAELNGNFQPFYAIPGQDIFLSCFQIDPNTGAVSLNWGLWLLLAPALVAMALTLLVFRPRH